MNLMDGDEIVGMQLDHQGESLLIVSEKGYGKRTLINEFGLQYRGGKGVKCYKILEKTGDVIGVKSVNDDNEIMMITNEGVIIQIPMKDVSVLGRITSGVKVMNLEEGVSIAKIAKVREKISDGTNEYDSVEEADESINRAGASSDKLFVMHEEVDIDEFDTEDDMEEYDDNDTDISSDEDDPDDI
jgi:DNA gyrase subunit A